MKAVQFSRFGGPDVLELVDAPMPEPKPGEVLVKVVVAGINFADTLMRQDRYAMTPPIPSVLGSEVAGIVAGLGNGVTGLELGDRVAAPMFAANVHFGGYAEYVVLDAAYIVPLPDALSFEHAVAVMVQGLTAAFLLRQAPPRDKTVLISAAAGGVGAMLVQLALAAGATTVIAAASSEEKRDHAKALGADITLDYGAPGWTEQLVALNCGAGPDIIYESVGGSITSDCLAILAPQGEMLVFGALNIQSFALGVPELMGLIFKNQSITGFALVPLLDPASLREELAQLFTLATEGRLTITIGGTFSLETVADAHRLLESRGAIGKLIIVPNPT